MSKDNEPIYVMLKGQRINLRDFRTRAYTNEDAALGRRMGDIVGEHILINYKYRQIPDFPKYTISRTGRIRSLLTGKPVKPMYNTKDGRTLVNLSHNGECHTKVVGLLRDQTWGKP